MIYKYKDSTTQGYVDRMTTAYKHWESEWDYVDGKLVCLSFKGDNEDVLAIIKVKQGSQYGVSYHQAIRAFNRHKIEVEKEVGIYVEKKKKIDMVKVIYRDYDRLSVTEVKKGAVSIGGQRRPKQTPWTEDKQKWVDEYNKNTIEHRRIQNELWTKIFGGE